jgi:two-component system, OmpR family, sensor histidine kinase BaeS
LPISTPERKRKSVPVVKQRLLVKLLGINVPVVALVIVVLWFVLDTLAANYFALLMKEYHISPLDAHRMFIDSIHRYILWTSIGALALGAVLSFFFTQMVLRPLQQMTETARSISAGDYSSRVRTDSRDEIGELSRAFNQMAENLERIERLRRDMVSNVAHELRTPLTNINGYLEALQDGVVPPTRETFELLQEETLRLTHLVIDLLELARADAAKTSLHLDKVDISQLTARVLKRFELKLGHKRIQVETDWGQTSGAMADRDKAAQVIENLVKNALQYTPEGGSIKIRLQTTQGELRFTIENSGPGIEPRDLPFIFERFYRGEKSRSRDFGGTGIGLTIVRELVEAHEGKTGVESAPGRTIFWFTLPRG